MLEGQGTRAAPLPIQQFDPVVAPRVGANQHVGSRYSYPVQSGP